jgi:hypothetical protein
MSLIIHFDKYLNAISYTFALRTEPLHIRSAPFFDPNFRVSSVTNSANRFSKESL